MELPNLPVIQEGRLAQLEEKMDLMLERTPYDFPGLGASSAEKTHLIQRLILRQNSWGKMLDGDPQVSIK